MLLCVVWLLNARGPWLPIAVTSILFVILLVLGPIWLKRMPLPWLRHRTVVALAADSVALLLLILVPFAMIGHPELWVTEALPIAAFALLLPWGIALCIRYLPLNGLLRAAVATAFGSVFAYIATPGLRAFTGEQPAWQPVDLTVWNAQTVPGNVLLLAVTTGLVAAVILAIAGVFRRR